MNLKKFRVGELSFMIEDANKIYIRKTLFHLQMEFKFVDSLDFYVEGVRNLLIHI